MCCVGAGKTHHLQGGYVTGEIWVAVEWWLKEWALE